MEYPSWSKKELKTVLGCNLRNERMISISFQGKPFSITVVQVYVPTSNTKKLKLNSLWWPTRPSRTNTKRRCPSHHRGLECKSRKSRDTWTNRQVWPWSKKWSRAKANRVLPREYTGHSKHTLPATQEMTLHMGITRWSILKSEWLYSLQVKMEKLYTVRKKTRPELTVAQIMNSLLQNSDLNWRK